MTDRRRPWLDEETAWSRVAASHTCVLTTLRRDGRPVSLPLWFVVIDRRVYFRSLATGKKVARIRNDPRASVLIESGQRWRELVAVHLSGSARIVDESDPIIPEIQQAIDIKYDAFRSSDTNMPETTKAHYAQPYAFICFEPDDKIVSWDNSRLFD
ncbi:MAG: pyridoxamine 5'-phosphate oxidase family protein [Ilumatobacteraceae bacterium]